MCYLDCLTPAYRIHQVLGFLLVYFYWGRMPQANKLCGHKDTQEWRKLKLMLISLIYFLPTPFTRPTLSSWLRTVGRDWRKFDIRMSVRKYHSNILVNSNKPLKIQGSKVFDSCLILDNKFSKLSNSGLWTTKSWINLVTVLT